MEDGRTRACGCGRERERERRAGWWNGRWGKGDGCVVAVNNYLQYTGHAWMVTATKGIKSALMHTVNGVQILRTTHYVVSSQGAGR
jgi:hypothetical protein